MIGAEICAEGARICALQSKTYKILIIKDNFVSFTLKVQEFVREGVRICASPLSDCFCYLLKSAPIANFTLSGARICAKQRVLRGFKV